MDSIVPFYCRAVLLCIDDHGLFNCSTVKRRSFGWFLVWGSQKKKTKQNHEHSSIGFCLEASLYVSASLPTLFFFKTFLAIFSFALSFHIHFRIILSLFTSNPAGVFMEIVLSLYIGWGTSDIFTAWVFPFVDPECFSICGFFDTVHWWFLICGIQILFVFCELY